MLLRIRAICFFSKKFTINARLRTFIAAASYATFVSCGDESYLNQGEEGEMSEVQNESKNGQLLINDRIEEFNNTNQLEISDWKIIKDLKNNIAKILRTSQKKSHAEIIESISEKLNNSLGELEKLKVLRDIKNSMAERLFCNSPVCNEIFSKTINDNLKNIEVSNSYDKAYKNIISPHVINFPFMGKEFECSKESIIFSKDLKVANRDYLYKNGVKCVIVKDILKEEENFASDNLSMFMANSIPVMAFESPYFDLLQLGENFVIDPMKGIVSTKINETMCRSLCESHFTYDKLEAIKTIQDEELLFNKSIDLANEFLKETILSSIFTKIKNENDLYNKIYKDFYDKTVSDEFIPGKKIENFNFLQSINPFDEKVDLKKEEAPYSVVFLMDCFMEPCENIDSGVTGNSEGSHNRTLAEVVGSWNKLKQTPVFFHTWDEYMVKNIESQLKEKNLKANFISIKDVVSEFYELKKNTRELEDVGDYIMGLKNEFKEILDLFNNIKGNGNRALRYAGVNTMRLMLMSIISEKFKGYDTQVIYADKTVIPYPEMLESREDKFTKHSLYRTKPYTSFIHTGTSLENTCMIYNKPKSYNLFTNEKVLFSKFLGTAKEFIEYYYNNDIYNDDNYLDKIYEYDGFGFNRYGNPRVRSPYVLKKKPKNNDSCVFSLQQRWMEHESKERDPLFPLDEYPILVSRASSHK